MFNQAQAFREYLTNRETQMDSEKSQERHTSNLFNEKTFYKAFIKDLLEAKKEVVIYSPFTSKFRTDFLKQTIEKLRQRNIEILIFTRPIEEYESVFQAQIECALKRYEELGACVFYLSGSIHEKVAVIDREILWEGSLNILSQRASREIMRRTSGEASAIEVMDYLGLNKKLEAGYKLRYENLCGSLSVNSKSSRKQKTKIFFLGFGLAMILWWIFPIVGGMIPVIRLISHLF